MGTKEKILNGFMQLVVKNQTVNISVIDLCNYLHISRRSFYNYFFDRQEVVEEIFINKIEETIKKCLEDKMQTKDFLIQVYYSFLKDKSFFVVAIKEDGQNSLFDTMILRMQIVFKILFKEIIDDKRELEYLSHKYASSSAMLLKKWMKDGMIESPEFITKIYLSSYNDYEDKHEEIISKQHNW